jgi:integrase
MINIRLQDLEISDHCKIRVLGKGSKIRYCFIKLSLYQRILDTFHSKDHLFESKSHQILHRVNVSKKISDLGKIIGKRIHAHTLRHSCIMHLLNYKNLKYVSKYAGHSTSAITADMYVHESPDAEVIDFFDDID